MHICFLTPEYVIEGAYDGGLANYLQKISRLLTISGHNVTILVSSNRNHTWMDEAISVIEFKRVKLIQKRHLGSINIFLPIISNLMTDWCFRNQVIKIHQKKPIDLIQASSYSAPGFGLRHNGLFPMVCRLSSYTPLLRSAYGFRRNFGDYLTDWLEIRQILDAEASFAPSYFLADTFRKLEGSQPVVIRTPIVLDQIEEDDHLYLEQFQNIKYLLFFGTLSRIKGVDLLAEVIPGIMEKFADIHFVLIGRDDGLPGGNKIYNHILEKCQSYKARLYYRPSISKAQLYPIIRHALGVLMPSRTDNYPNACLEALSFGVPVIGTDQSSLEEMIIDGETGFLAKNGDPSSIQKAIEHLLNLSVTERSVLQKNIQAWVKTQKSEDRIGQLINLYQEVIDQYRR